MGTQTRSDDGPRPGRISSAGGSRFECVAATEKAATPPTGRTVPERSDPVGVVVKSDATSGKGIACRDTAMAGIRDAQKADRSLQIVGSSEGRHAPRHGQAWVACARGRAIGEGVASPRPIVGSDAAGHVIRSVSCADCGRSVDSAGRCWRCCNRPCVQCGKMTGTAFIEICLICELAPNVQGK